MAQRPEHSDTPPLWVEEGEVRTAPLITAAPLAPIDKVYTFTATPEMAAQLRVGQRVRVPLGRKSRMVTAIVVDIATGPWTSALKEVAEVLDPAGQLSGHLLELGKWISRYYCCPLGRTLSAMVPQAVRQQSGFVTMRRVELIASADSLAQEKMGPKQRRIVDLLLSESAPIDASSLLGAAGTTRTTLRSLIDKGWVREIVVKEAQPADLGGYARAEPEFDLNDQQQAALDRVIAATETAEFKALLLWGVSGSGKTEVYVHAMRRVLAAGRQAIMLVPEIALTTQLMQRLAARFERVAVVHSGLTGSQRSLIWEEIRTGRAPVVIGTRSAVFAPCPNPGLIVVDEEQEPGYKNQQSPRFHVRDVAIKRASMLGIPIVLGSATPSLETWHNVQRLPAYLRIDLPRRVRELPLPEVRMVNMRTEAGPPGGLTVSASLHRELHQTLERGEQAVLLINRRGYSTWLFCPACRHRVQCPNCQASMVLHLARNRMLCHHCHAGTSVPVHCPDASCRARLVRGGGGTERIEEELAEAFPSARIHRADSDTMNHAVKYQELVQRFEQGDIDILVGTQMIAKGLDFPNVSLVGVIGADFAGSASDFRASERLFQLVTQVAGRAGRAEVPGRVVVQSLSPEQPALRFALTHDFAGFAAAELRRRQSFGYPPFGRMTRFVLAGKREREVRAEADELAGRLAGVISQAATEDTSLLGPHPCAIERIKGLYRYELLLRAPHPHRMMAVLDAARQAGSLKSKLKSFIIDVDPVSLS